MGRPRTLFRSILEVVGLAGLILLLVLLLRARPSGDQPGAQPAATPQPYPLSALPEQSAHPSGPYPPPVKTPPAPPLPAKIQALIGKRSVLGNVSTVALDHGRLWLLPPDDQAKTLTDFGDVAAIYGWNHDGSKLLFGRGLYETRGEFAKATELWVYDAHSKEAYRLVDSRQIWSASWSPVDDLVAYCEYGETPTVSIVSLDGKVQQKRNEFLFSDLAWSPDGSAIAVSYSGPNMVDYDTRYSVLGIWWLEKDELQLMSDATREAQYFPIWLMDGNNILFTRIFGPGSSGGESGLYIVDIQSRQMVPLQNGPKSIVNTIIRSPRSDSFVFWMGYDVYAMELGKEPVLIGKGSKPIWHPNGQTIFYTGENGFYNTKTMNFPMKDHFTGGYFNASTIHLQPDIFFKMGGSK
jgi:hypothetical protein